MKFLLDENFPKSAARVLTNSGHTVIDIRGTELQGIDDASLFGLALAERAILLTTDRDFYHTVPLQYAEHSGVIVIALKQPNRSAILSRLSWLLEQDLLADIENKIILLRDNTLRVR